jgi:hypothetical protein
MDRVFGAEEAFWAIGKIFGLPLLSLEFPVVTSQAYSHFNILSSIIKVVYEIRCQFHQFSMNSFYPESIKKDLQLDSLFYAFGICDPKSCT